MKQKPATCPTHTNLEAVPKGSEIVQPFKHSKTLGEFLKKTYQPRMEFALASLQPGHRECIIRDVLRYCEPWPEWVLRVAAEICQVDLPTVPKETIKANLRWIHALFFEVRLDGSSLPESIPPPKLDPEVMGALMGHLVAHLERWNAELGKASAKELLSSDAFAESSRLFSLEVMQQELVPHLSKYLEIRSTGFLAFNDALKEARMNTVGKSGERKETTLTRVYRALFEDWPRVERLSGPTALCDFLSPVLKGNESDPEKRLDRVKKVCRRMGVQFQRTVKGQG